MGLVEIRSPARDEVGETARTRLWNNLANIKFKALYTCECSKRAGYMGRLYSFAIALSASSIAAWAVWQQHSTTWAMILGVSQFLQVAIPYIPFLKSEKEYLTMSYEFEALYLNYEKIWYDFRDGSIDETTVKKTITEFRLKEVQIEKAGVHCLRFRSLINRVSDETTSVLQLDLI